MNEQEKISQLFSNIPNLQTNNGINILTKTIDGKFANIKYHNNFITGKSQCDLFNKNSKMNSLCLNPTYYDVQLLLVKFFNLEYSKGSEINRKKIEQLESDIPILIEKFNEAKLLFNLQWTSDELEYSTIQNNNISSNEITIQIKEYEKIVEQVNSLKELRKIIDIESYLINRGFKPCGETEVEEYLYKITELKIIYYNVKQNKLCVNFNYDKIEFTPELDDVVKMVDFIRWFEKIYLMNKK